MTWIAGVDGFRSEWCVVLHKLGTDMRDETVVADFCDLLNLPHEPEVIAIDIPIGLPQVTLTGGRSCDRLAREKIGFHRARSVFSPPGLVALEPTLVALGTRGRAEAHKRHIAAGGIGIGAQAWGLAEKLWNVHVVMTAGHQGTVHEVHPEVSFREMAGRPVVHSKRTKQGERERVEILTRRGGFPREYIAANPPKLERVKRDDFLDACAALWTAERIAKDVAKRLPEISEESGSLDMAIWY